MCDYGGESETFLYGMWGFLQDYNSSDKNKRKNKEKEEILDMLN